MLPSPFDNVHGGASAVAHIPSSMQQGSAPHDGDKAAGREVPRLPSALHISLENSQAMLCRR